MAYITLYMSTQRTMSGEILSIPCVDSKSSARGKRVCLCGLVFLYWNPGHAKKSTTLS